VAFFGYGTRPDNITTYGERACAMGSYGKIDREDTMYILGNLAGSVHKFGA
jgi:2,3-bisphosphoglycerate-independent phosphoglycerate mutase